jgi:hypothetical protein
MLGQDMGMLVEDTDDLGHLSFDPREPLVRLAPKVQLSTVALSQAVDECGLVLDQGGQRVIKATMAILCGSLSGQDNLPSLTRKAIAWCLNRGGGIRTHDLLRPRQAR